MEFCDRLKALRTQAGMTQAQLAQRLGVTKSVVSFYELRERAPSPEVLVRIAQVFRVSTDYLLGVDRQDTIDVTGLCDRDIGLLRALADSLRQKMAQG